MKSPFVDELGNSGRPTSEVRFHRSQCAHEGFQVFFLTVIAHVNVMRDEIGSPHDRGETADENVANSMFVKSPQNVKKASSAHLSKRRTRAIKSLRLAAFSSASRSLSAGVSFNIAIII